MFVCMCMCLCVCVCVCVCVCARVSVHVCVGMRVRRWEGECYGVASISRLLKIIGLFCRISSLLIGSFAKETYNLKEPTNRSQPIARVRVRE